MKIVILSIYLYVLDREIERERYENISSPRRYVLAFFFFLCDLQISQFPWLWLWYDDVLWRHKIFLSKIHIEDVTLVSAKNSSNENAKARSVPKWRKRNHVREGGSPSRVSRPFRNDESSRSKSLVRSLVRSLASRQRQPRPRKVGNFFGRHVENIVQLFSRKPATKTFRQCFRIWRTYVRRRNVPPHCLTFK